jgi:hypothetical protein
LKEFLRKVHFPAKQPYRANWEKRLANLWRRNKLNKRAHTDHGQEIKWEIANKVATVAPGRPGNRLPGQA